MHIKIWLFQALSNIRDFKQSLLGGIFPARYPLSEAEPVGEWLVQDAEVPKGTKVTAATSYYHKPQTQG